MVFVCREWHHSFSIFMKMCYHIKLHNYGTEALSSANIF